MGRFGTRTVTAGVLLVMLLAACGESDPAASPGGAASSPAASSPEAEASSAPAPIPEGQSLMDPGSYLARTEPNAVITTASPWYGAANVPGFVVFGQLDQFPYAELYLLNLEDVIKKPGDPGDPWKVVPAPDDLFSWFVERTGMQTVGAPVSVEIDGYEGQQVDLRVGPDTECAPQSTRPWPGACLLIFTIEGDPPVFPFGAGMMYRLVVLPDVAGQTVTILYSDDAAGFSERVQVADEVVRSITFDV